MLTGSTLTHLHGNNIGTPQVATSSTLGLLLHL
jgi:hypothetical protein